MDSDDVKFLGIQLYSNLNSDKLNKIKCNGASKLLNALERNVNFVFISQQCIVIIRSFILSHPLV